MINYLIKNRDGKRVREYMSDSFYHIQFSTEVNLKENIFVVYKIDVETGFSQPYLSLKSPKRVLDELGYRLNDFSDFREVTDFIDAIVHRTQRTRENVFNATFYTACVRDYNLKSFKLHNFGF